MSRARIIGLALTPLYPFIACVPSAGWTMGFDPSLGVFRWFYWASWVGLAIFVALGISLQLWPPDHHLPRLGAIIAAYVAGLIVTYAITLTGMALTPPRRAEEDA